MGRKIALITATVSILLILLIVGLGTYTIYSLNNHVPESSEEIVAYTEERVETYLLDEVEYTRDQVKSIESSRKAKEADSSPSGYEVKVTFTDEPDAFYYYEVDDGKVHQSGISGNAEKHREDHF